MSKEINCETHQILDSYPEYNLDSDAEVKYFYTAEAGQDPSQNILNLGDGQLVSHPEISPDVRVQRTVVSAASRRIAQKNMPLSELLEATIDFPIDEKRVHSPVLTDGGYGLDRWISSADPAGEPDNHYHLYLNPIFDPDSVGRLRHEILREKNDPHIFGQYLIHLLNTGPRVLVQPDDHKITLGSLNYPTIFQIHEREIKAGKGIQGLKATRQNQVEYIIEVFKFRNGTVAEIIGGMRFVIGDMVRLKRAFDAVVYQEPVPDERKLRNLVDVYVRAQWHR